MRALLALLFLLPALAAAQPHAAKEETTRAYMAQLLRLGAQRIPKASNHCDNEDGGPRRVEVRDILRDGLTWTLTTGVPSRSQFSCKDGKNSRGGIEQDCELLFAIGPFAATRDTPAYEGASVLLKFRARGGRILTDSLECLATP